MMTCANRFVFAIDSLDQGIDTVRAKAKWLERDTQDVESWLKAQQYL